MLDFGIAKSLSSEIDAHDEPGEQADESRFKTQDGSLVGTPPYMSPEQFSDGPTDQWTIDHQVDVWAAGIMLFELVAGKHPMAPLSMRVFQRIADMRIPMPWTGELCSQLGALAPIIDRCLLKDKADRIGSVSELIADLKPHVPGQRMLALADDASPFTGLSAFQESDADRFFGRDEDILAVVSRVREQPLVAVIGPSGAGKSSLVRAGVTPALKRSGEGWQSYIARPGRAPLRALAEVAELASLGKLISIRALFMGMIGGPDIPDLSSLNGQPLDQVIAPLDALVEQLQTVRSAVPLP